MVIAIAGNLLSDNVRILKNEVSKAAYQGVLIAVITIVIATLMVSFFTVGELSLDGIVSAQKSNIALWFLDSTPFVFGIWGQYSSTMIAYKAGAMIFDQTQELRNTTNNLEKQANYISSHDFLTDLPNRALFYDRVEKAILIANDHNQLLSILLMEIENFKDIYNTLGQNTSDLVLKQVSARLRKVSKEKDIIAKVDGNVFAFLLVNIANLTIAERLAQTIQQVMEPPFVINQFKVIVHPNIGIVHFPDHGDDADTLVQRASVTLHTAQQSSIGYCIYEPTFDKLNPKRLTLMSEFRDAIEHDELELFYQAKVSIQTGQLVGAEALVRWNHPVYGVTSPDDFIPMMAEYTRIIKHVTLWTFQRAFHHCANWHKQGIDIKVCVNLSIKELHDPDLPDLIAGVAASTGVRPEWIMLETSEGAIMNDPESALEIIERLHRMGYQFSIDDFGAEFTSLAYLKKMPLTELKINKSFVMDIMNSENDATIVKAIINLAHNLGLQVTAIGIESEEIMAKLKEYGCDMAQGYFLHKPLSATDFNKWMNNTKWKAIGK
ncbi:MAG: bifunctional diguanylate cyclase/phosphodiesterase [Methylococcales bacterium]|nr:bifunctional diguanylate cyclase/phosphodiesterase [Methylococcales bacterium]